ncbi:peptidoglycan DD-metalloendopeptidase family protein [Georgenia sp. AZ-5]|uniref:M23 family metallopeptidase n=1 Tax=Georgenia sp. AZ-5 TaxID=3367526 RepID=UPI0037549E30
MPSRALPTTGAPLTRRQIREAERARERLGLAAPTEAPQPATPTADSTPVAPAEDVVTTNAPATETSKVAPGAAASVYGGDADGIPTAVLIRPAVRRRDLRVQASATPHRRRVRVPHVAALGVLGALTVVTPVVGAVDGADSAAAATVRTQPSVLGPLSASFASAELEQGGTPESLKFDPNAEARAQEVAASRAAERQALEEAAAAEAAAAQAAAEEAARQEARANAVVMPLAAGTYRHTSGYGNRNDPLGRGAAYSLHLGTDMAAPRNTPIHAAAAGTVVHAGAGIDGRSSNLIIIEHNINGEKFFTWYVHMYNDGVYVSAGQQVAAGDVIGGVGSNGNSTGDHLHFEVHLADGDTTTDPLAWLAQHGAKDVSELP